MGDIQRVPRGRWEKIGFWLLVFPVIPAMILIDIFEALGLGYWGSVVVVVVLMVVGMYVLSRPIRAERARRLAKDLERGVFDCAIRFPHSLPGSLRGLWESGAAELQGTTFRFQTRLGDEQGSPAGRVKTFSNAVIAPATDPPTRKPQGWTRDWRYVHLQTDGGLLQIAGSERTCRFIEASVPSSQEANRAGGNSDTTGKSLS